MLTLAISMALRHAWHVHDGAGMRRVTAGGHALLLLFAAAHGEQKEHRGGAATGRKATAPFISSEYRQGLGSEGGDPGGGASYSRSRNDRRAINGAQGDDLCDVVPTDEPPRHTQLLEVFHVRNAGVGEWSVSQHLHAPIRGVLICAVSAA